MRFINFENDELTVALSIEEQTEISIAIHQYNEYLKEILAGYKPGEIKSMENDVEILSRLEKLL